MAGAAGATTRGVDSTAATTQALASGQQLAKEFGCIVGISGAEDLVPTCFLECVILPLNLDSSFVRNSGDFSDTVNSFVLFCVDFHLFMFGIAGRSTRSSCCYSALP